MTDSEVKNIIDEHYRDEIGRILRYDPEAFYAKGAKYITKRLDEICSITVRIRDKFTCQLCGKAYPQVVPQNGHILGRGKYEVRWYEPNMYCQCDGENKEQSHRPEKFRLKWIDKIGQAAYDGLIEASRPRRLGTAEKIELFKYWRGRLVEELNKIGYDGGDI